MTPTETPEFLGPLRDQLVHGAAAHRRRRRSRTLAAGSALAAIAVVAMTVAVVAATRDDLEVVMAPVDQPVGAGGTAPQASVTTVHDGSTTTDDVSMWEPAMTTLAGSSYPGLFWTGDRLLVINTENEGGEVAGERWDPARNEPTPMAPSGLPWRVDAAMGWTGDELLVIGGSNGPGLGQIGAAYRPATDTWRTIADPPVVGGENEWSPAPRGPAMWTGSELVLPASGLAYRPADDTWRTIAVSPLSDRARPVTVGTGSQFVVWGGCMVRGSQCDEINDGLLGDGAVYDVATDAWTALPPSPLTPAVHAVGVWDGDEVVITVTEPGAGGTGARTAAWSPATGEWRVLPDPRLSDRRFAAAVWTGSEVVVWGGTGKADGAVFDRATGTWTSFEGPTPAVARGLHSMAWAGDRVYISATLQAPLPLVLRPGARPTPPEQATPPATRPPDPGGAVLPDGQPVPLTEVGKGYSVDVDLVCGAFELAGSWVLDEGDLSTWQPPGERHEGGMFTLDAIDHGTFRGDAAGTKVATFRRLPDGEAPPCAPVPR
jgi:hypothetical protein